jgi:O-antigen/teichoic acid export membrane protein
MALQTKLIEAGLLTVARSTVSEFREALRPQLQYGIGLAIQKGLPFLLIPVLVTYYGDQTYSRYVLFYASTLMFLNFTSLAVPNAIIPFWYGERDKHTLSWTFLLLMLVAQAGLSLFMGLGLFYIYRQSFGTNATVRLTLLGVVFAFLTNLNSFLTGVCRARQHARRFLTAQVFAGAALVGCALLLRGIQQLDILVTLFIIFLLCQDVYLLGSVNEYLWHSRPQFDWRLARGILGYSLPLLPHLEAIAFYFWIDKYVVQHFFTATQFSGFIVSFQYAYAQSLFSATLGMYTFPQFCKLVAKRQDTRIRSVLRTYNLIYAGLGTLWIVAILALQRLHVPLRINSSGFLVLGAAFLLWNVASNYTNVLWARFKTPAVTGVTVGAGLILLAVLFIGYWSHSLMLCYLSHLGWAMATLLGLVWLEYQERKPSGFPAALPRVAFTATEPDGKRLAMADAYSSKLTLFQCGASLEVLHAHLVRAAHCGEGGDWVIAFPEWVSRLVLRQEMWAKVLAVADTRPEYGHAAAKIRKNLEVLAKEVPLARYRQIDLVVSDLFFPMNNVLVAYMARFCQSEKIGFTLSLMDEGSVLYAGTRLGVRRALKSFAKFAYLKLHRFPALLIHPGNADYLNPLCTKVFCLHPELLDLPQHVEMERIDPGRMAAVYGLSQAEIQLPARSCLYLSQPLYKTIDMGRQLTVVQESKRYLQKQGIIHFYYKAHHADLPEWLGRLESDCGFRPLALQDRIPVELVARTCDADVVLGHSTSALLNLRLYGYRGRIVSFGLQKLRAAAEPSQYEDYLSAVKKLGQVELVP